MEQYIRAVLLWKDRSITCGRELAGALEDLLPGFVFHSLKMEGDDHVTYDLVRQVLEQGGVSGCVGDAQTVLDIRGAADGAALLLSAFDLRRPFSAQLLLEVHARLTLGQPETLAPHAAQMVAELEELLAHVRRRSVLVAAAYLLAQLERQPLFARSNGLTARMLTNYFLILHDHPPLIFFEEDRRDYRTVIDALDPEHHLAPLVRFLQEQLTKTWAEGIRRDEEDDTLWLEGP